MKSIIALTTAIFKGNSVFWSCEIDKQKSKRSHFSYLGVGEYYDEAVSKLLDNGAEPNIGRRHNDTALIIAAKKCTWNYSHKNNIFECNNNFLICIITHIAFKDIIRKLIEKGADVNAVGDKGKFEFIQSHRKLVTIGLCRIYSVNGFFGHYPAYDCTVNRKRSKHKCDKRCWWFGIEYCSPQQKKYANADS